MMHDLALRDQFSCQAPGTWSLPGIRLTTGWTSARSRIAAFLPVFVLTTIDIGAGYYLLVMRKKK
jgi:hypothetical protein